MIDLKDVSKAYPNGVHALNHVNLHIDKGEFVYVIGATGSGKSTTLASMIDHINSTRSEHILTIEDPIEFVHTSKKSVVHQRELGQDTRSFANALRSALREDPDIILVGEMRDQETISLALTAAETGHLVFATMHTNDAIQTIYRIVNMYEPEDRDSVRRQLAQTLRGTIAQKLVKKAVGNGRYPACEILVVTPTIKDFKFEAKGYHKDNQTTSANSAPVVEKSYGFYFREKTIPTHKYTR